MFSQKKAICYFVEPLSLNSIFKINILHYLILISNHLALYLKDDVYLIYCGRK
jgi:hypothetical protein